MYLLSELIHDLKMFELDHGDLPVAVWVDEPAFVAAAVDSIRFVEGPIPCISIGGSNQ